MMPATFAAQSGLFSSGPTRVWQERRGRVWREAYTTPNETAAIQDLGERDLVLHQSGVLTGETDAQLWARVDAIVALAEEPRTGNLSDGMGRTWSGVTLVEARFAGAVRRGRVRSVAYELSYVRLGS